MNTWMVTGSMGCIGAWAVAELVRAGERVVSFDLSENRQRLHLVIDPDEVEGVTFVKGNLTDTEAVKRTVADHGVTRIVHLAALQVPFCKADPVMGSRVNVTGTVNVFEAARSAGVERIAYASSIAVYGPPDAYDDEVLPPGSPYDPRTLYGVYKRANEGIARMYAQDYGVSSVALRPYTVYGLGRDQGLTSEPTKAMLLAAAGRDAEITFGGRMQFHHARDVAKAFLQAADGDAEGAHGFDLGGPVHAVADVGRMIEEVADVAVTVADAPLPFPDGVDEGDLESVLPGWERTPLRKGVQETIEAFRQLLAQGRVAQPG